MRAVAETSNPTQLVTSWLVSTQMAACASSADYETFRQQVRDFYPSASEVFVVGSANWGYSLNPKKNFRPFGTASDVDVATVSALDFEATWDVLRDFHRRRYYAITTAARLQLRRNGENVYSGFVSPEWMPERGNPLRYNFRLSLQRLSTALVQNLPVRMLFFRNRDEVIDYYRRGVMRVRTELPHGI